MKRMLSYKEAIKADEGEQGAVSTATPAQTQ